MFYSINMHANPTTLTQHRTLTNTNVTSQCNTSIIVIIIIVAISSNNGQIQIIK